MPDRCATSARARRGRTAVFALALFVLLTGCAQHARVICDPLEKASRREFDAAVASLEATKLAESDRDRFLYHAQRGHLLHLAGDFEASNEAFERAVAAGEELEPTSVTATIADYTLNEAVKAYPGEDYERAYLHYYMALNYLALDDQEAALVECRRLDRVFRELDARYDDERRFRDDGFIRYLSGLIYESTGRINDAFVDYKAAVRAYRSAPGFSSLPDGLVSSLRATGATLGLDAQVSELLGENDDAAADSADVAPSGQNGRRAPTPAAHGSRPDSEIVVIIDAGWAPFKQERSVEVPIYRPLVPEGLRGEDWLAALVKVAYPEYVSVPLSTDAFTASATPVDPDGGARVARAEKVKDIDRLARETLERRLGALKLRSTMRATAKQIALMKQKADHAEGAENRSIGERILRGILERTATVLTAETEQADTRSWVTLPREVHLARIGVPPGVYAVELRAGGDSSLVDTVLVDPDRKVFRPARVIGGPHPVRCERD